MPNQLSQERVFDKEDIRLPLENLLTVFKLKQCINYSYG